MCSEGRMTTTDGVLQLFNASSGLSVRNLRAILARLHLLRRGSKRAANCCVMNSADGGGVDSFASSDGEHDSLNAEGPQAKESYFLGYLSLDLRLFGIYWRIGD
jgi:hypothetical protein